MKKSDLNTKVISKRTAVASIKNPNEPDTMDLIQQKWDKQLSKHTTRQEQFALPEDEEQPNRSIHSEDQDNMFKGVKDEGEKTNGHYDDIVEHVENLRLETMMKEKSSN